METIFISDPNLDTTRPQRAGEQAGVQFYFTTYETMMNDIKDNKYLEYGTHENACYGTKKDTILKIHQDGMMAILDVEPQVMFYYCCRSIADS